MKLEIEYDGTRFKGRAKQAGERTVQEELEAALETVLREPVKVDRGRAHRYRRACRGPGGELRHRRRDARESGAAPQRPRPARYRGDSGDADGRDGFDARARRESPVPTATASSPVPAPVPSSQNRSLWWPHKMDYEALEACADGPDRHARLHRLHPDPDRPRPLRPQHPRRRLDPRRRHRSPSASPPTPSCATWSASSSARSSRSPGAAAPWRTSAPLLGGARREAGDTAPPHGLYLESVSYES